MKEFLKMLLAVIVGMAIVTTLSIVVCTGLIGASLSAGTQNILPRSGALVVDMSHVVIGEQTQALDPMTSVMATFKSQEVTMVGIWDAVRAVKAAAEDPAVKCIYRKTDGSTTPAATLSEFRKALSDFRSSGKPVVSYIESPTTGSYYLASVADKVYMTSYQGASSMINGVSAQMFFLKDLLDRFGINVQLIRHGKYKSAGEMYVRNAPSEENREQYQVMINSLWNSMAAEIAGSRGIEVSALNDAVDNLKLNLPSDFVECGLVDELLSRDQLQDKLATLCVVDSYSKVGRIQFADYVAAKSVPSKSNKKIAVIYVDGEIVDGDFPQEVAGDRFAAIVEKVRRDSTVKAVVLRVNSPGGSVLASEKIKHELDLLSGTKPLVASYGDYAASGGYWISNNADKIFSDAMTLTGSIGVFGMVPELSKALRDVAHVGVANISSSRHGDMYSFTRPLDSEEMAYMQSSIESVYDKFVTIVSEGRGMDKSTVDALGQGRVWTGADALGCNLVDEIGTLEDALSYAAVSAGDPEIANWNVKAFPRPLTTLDYLLETINGASDMDEKAVWMRRMGDLTKARVIARMPYEIRF